MPSNFRTYEAQSRLLAAVIASSPNLKLNFKAIAQHYGSDMTEWAAQHRFRPVRKQATALQKAVAEGKDAKDMEFLFRMNDKEIAKYFGESTPMGIEFQFRAIKKDAQALKDAVDKGQSPLTARKNVPAASTAGTKRKASSDATPGGAGGPRARQPKRVATKRPKPDQVFSNEESLGSEDVDYDKLDVSPTATPVKQTPVSAAATLPATSVPMATPTHSNPLAPAVSAPPMTPLSTTTGFIPDATPALSIGDTPPENDESPAYVDLSGMGPLHQPQFQPLPPQHHHIPYQQSFQMSMGMASPLPPQPLKYQPSQSFYEQTSTLAGDDDDDVFVVDTPSKMPKMVKSEAPSATIPTSAAAAAAGAAMAAASATMDNHMGTPSFGGGEWPALGHNTSGTTLGSNSHISQSFTMSSSVPWSQPSEYFPIGSHGMSSFAAPPSLSQSFYENDDGV